VSAAPDERDRQVIPRWRSLPDTLALGELRSLQRPKIMAANVDDELRDLHDDWARHQSPSFASDFVGVALAVGARRVADEAAKFLTTSPEATSAQQKLGRFYLRAIGPGQLQLAPVVSSFIDRDARARIATSRASVSRDARNAIAWTEQARAHAVLGLTDRARRELTIAVCLAPENRFVLRAASAFFVHAGEPDHAHSILLRASEVANDPWLLAAEIATSGSAGIASRLIKRGIALVQKDIEPSHLTELASALGTVELFSGSSKRAKTLFRASLNAANENAIAQAEWASGRLAGVSPQRHEMEMPLAYEARTRRDVEKGEWATAVANSWSWFYDQPFAVGAAIFGSHAAAMGLRDYDEAIRFAEAGLVANPEDALLLNNYAFALLQRGETSHAATVLRRITSTHADPRVRTAITATCGLLAFRQGDVELGQQLYTQAIANAKRLGTRDMAALAEIMLAREELRAKGVGVASEVLRVLRSVENTPGLAIREWVTWVSEEVASKLAG